MDEREHCYTDWGLATVVFLVINGVQFALPFPCSLTPEWSVIATGTPLSMAGGLIAAGLARLRLNRPRFPLLVWVLGALLAVLGLPFYLLGHMCG